MASSENATMTAPDDRYRDLYNVAQFVTGLILYPVFCCFGLTGNCLTLVVLRSRKLGGVTSTFLAALAVSDGVKLINDLFYFLVILLLHVRPAYGDLAFNIIYPYAHLVAMVIRLPNYPRKAF